MSIRERIIELLRLVPPTAPAAMTTVSSAERADHWLLRAIHRGDEGEEIPAFLLLPKGDGPFPAVVVWHQHNGDWLGERARLRASVGARVQAIGPMLAARGFAVFAPDVITFEDRRAHASGTDPHLDDWLRHYNEMTYRLVRGDLLRRNVLDDAQRVRLHGAHVLEALRAYG